jgi:hypothetical protein
MEGIVKRWRVPEEARAALEASYAACAYPTPDECRRLGEAVGATPRRVKVWFQNRRQRAPLAIPVATQVVPLALAHDPFADAMLLSYCEFSLTPGVTYAEAAARAHAHLRTDDPDAWSARVALALDAYDAAREVLCGPDEAARTRARLPEFALEAYMNHFFPLY